MRQGSVGGIMSDISLAVGDGARRMTYAELAAVRGISALSAERLVRCRALTKEYGKFDNKAEGGMSRRL